MISLKRRFIKVLLLLVVPLLIFMLVYFNNRDERVFFHQNYVMLGGSLSSTHNGCQLPININPFDQTVSKYIELLPPSITCKHQTDPFNNLTFIDSNGVLRQTDSHFNCKYQFFRRTHLNDDLILYHQKLTIDPINGISMNNHTFVAVECIHTTSQQIYTNTHFWFPLTKNNDNLFENQSETFNKPSVLILVIESLSRINYLRFMSKTKESLENFGQIVYMKGLTKLADNSFPNMVPFLTGKRVWNHELLNEDHGPYDDWPFVWKDFSKAGYKTSLIEDFPTFTLFNYESKGFLEKPTDWYPRPFWIHLFRDVSKLLLGLIPFDLSNCYNERWPKIEIFLQQIKHFMHECETNLYPYFTFAFYIEVTHNDFNRAQLIDSHISRFLEESRLELNNTIFILMGDHGNRFGSILQTVVGRIEERMPLFAIRVPNTINKRFPHLLNNLKSNSEKLLTWLDLHQLLKDIANNNYTQISQTKDDQHYYSPWRESIPETRTCQDAFIPENYCVCDNRKKLNTSDHIVISASLALVDHVNKLLPLHKCHNLMLKSSIEAELIFPSGSTAKPQGFEQRIEVTISVDPSDAIFRAQLSRTARSLEWSIKGEINRINKYGNQSHCVHERLLKPFCYCF